MRILLLMDPFIPVPPVHYGGIERVIYDIACKYMEWGHDVTLVAGPNSKSPGRFIEYGYNREIQSIKINPSLTWKVSTILWREIRRHDIIHNFGRLAWLFPIAWSSIRKVHTYMRCITPSNVMRLNQIGVRNIVYTAVSDAIVKTGISGGGDWRTVYNCAPIGSFHFVEKVDDDAPLVFLGRLERCKGAHSAIRVAKMTGKKLILAGNISALSEEKKYFENEILPLVDGDQIKYIGVVNNEEKNRLLGSAAAMLLPVEWYEPFPIVMPESFACGTPVLCFPGGGVPEGIIEGQTGYISRDVQEMAQHVHQIPSLSREACRREALSRYSDTRIASDYLKIYQEGLVF